MKHFCQLIWSVVLVSILTKCQRSMDKSVWKETDTTAANEPTSPAVTAAVGTTTALSGAPSTERLSTVDVSPPQMTPAAEGIHRCLVRTRYHGVKDCIPERFLSLHLFFQVVLGYAMSVVRK